MAQGFLVAIDEVLINGSQTQPGHQYFKRLFGLLIVFLLDCDFKYVVSGFGVFFLEDVQNVVDFGFAHHFGKSSLKCFLHESFLLISIKILDRLALFLLFAAVLLDYSRQHGIHKLSVLQGLLFALLQDELLEDGRLLKVVVLGRLERHPLCLQLPRYALLFFTFDLLLGQLFLFDLDIFPPKHAGHVFSN